MLSFGFFAVVAHGQDDTVGNTKLIDGECPDEGTWTGWLSRDLPSGTGDWETLALHFEVCSIPVAAEGRVKSTGADWTNEYVSFSATYGLVCQNADQPDGRCEDYEVRFCCAPEKTELVEGDCNQDTATWSSWFSRDLPSGTGDWELRSYIAQNTDELCENPTAAEARIVGTTELSTTEAVTFSASYGLVCVNNDQTDRRCENYEVRFCCEPEKTELVDGECFGEGTWSAYYSRDLPSGTGDWELRTLLAQTNDDVCDSPMAAEARIVGATDQLTSEAVVFSASYGLVCENADQPDGRCENYEIRFCCEPEFTELVTGECDAEWGPWVSRDLPSGTGDWELHSDSLNEGRRVCEVPIAAEARNVATLDTFTSEIVNFGLHGLVCQNINQFDGRCEDYEVRYCCESTPEPTSTPTAAPVTPEPTSTPTADPTSESFELQDGECSSEGYWSNWNSRDLPSGTGDWETLDMHTKQFGVCARPGAAEARIVGTTSLTTTEIVTFSSVTGLICKNADQTDRRCENYEVRFCCEPDSDPSDTKLTDGECPTNEDVATWSTWMSRDFPSLSGDWELRATLIQEGHLSEACQSPLAAEARIIGSTATWTPEIVTFSASYGLVCQNAVQTDGRCEDYEIRFCCRVNGSDDSTVNQESTSEIADNSLPAPSNP